MHFRMSAETLGQFVRIRQMLDKSHGITLDLESDDFLTDLFYNCGSSYCEHLLEAADKLWSCLSKDNPEIDKRRALNRLHRKLKCH